MARDTNYILYATGRTDPTYKHIWAFQNRQERANFLFGKPSNQFLNNKYWRVGTTIKVPISYEESFKYDYALIINDSSTGKKREWFCFVTSRLYISNNVTQLTMEVDIVQTYYFSNVVDGEIPFWNTNGFITRATGTEMPMRGIASDYTPLSRDIQTINYFDNNYYVVIYSSVNLTNDELTYTYGSVQGVIMTSVPYIIIGSDNADTLARYKTVMDKVNNNGWTASISNICVIPAELIQLKTPGIYELINIGVQEKSVRVMKPTNCNGYVPINKNLLEQDYSYVVINNNGGEEVKYRFDDFKNDYININIGASYNSGTVELYCYPTNYKDSATGAYRARVQKMTNVPLCTYDNDTYKIWLAQNQNSRNVAKNNAHNEIRYAEMQRDNSLTYQGSKYITPIINEIGKKSEQMVDALSGSVGSVLSDGQYRTLFGGGATRSFGTMNEQLITNKTNNTTGDIIKLAQLKIAQELGLENNINYDVNIYRAQDSLNQLMAGYADKALVSATSAGSNIYGSMTQFNQVGFYIMLITPTYEAAKQIDEMLSASGMTYNNYGFVSIKHQVYDYYAVNSADIESDITSRPQYARNVLLSLLDSGIYLWYYNNGDIDRHIGTPYGVDNPVLQGVIKK